MITMSWFKCVVSVFALWIAGAMIVVASSPRLLGGFLDLAMNHPILVTSGSILIATLALVASALTRRGGDAHSQR